MATSSPVTSSKTISTEKGFTACEMGHDMREILRQISNMALAGRSGLMARRMKGSISSDSNRAKANIDFQMARFTKGIFVLDVLMAMCRKKGTFYAKDGFFYEGEWLENQKHGFGKFRFSDGSLYEGMFANNLKEGQGTFGN